jgi:hypothetical protein
VRRIFILLMAGALGGPCSLAGASALGNVGSGTLGNGSIPVSACDSDGFTVTYVTSGGNVTSVTVGGIALACSGGSLKLTVVNSSRSSLATGGPATVSGTTASVSVSPNPAAATAAGVDVSITGP